MIKADRLLWFVPVLFLFDLILLGPRGAFPDYHVRYFLFLATLGVLVYFGFKSRGLCGNSIVGPFFLIAAFLAWNAVWVLVIPVIAGGTASLAWSDAKSLTFLVLAFLLVLAACGDKTTYRYLLVMMVVLASLLGWAQFVIWTIGNLSPELRPQIGRALSDVFQAKSIYVGPMGDGFYRVFWISTLWMLPAIFYLPVVTRNSFVQIVSLLGLVGSVYVSYSRGIWIGLVLGVLVFLVLNIRTIALGLKPGKFLLSLIIVMGLFIGLDALQSGNVWHRAGALASSEDISMNIRVEQVKQLITAWWERPLLGWGYGASAEDIRDHAAPYSYEMVPFALLMKLGVIGVFGWAVFFITIYSTGFRMLVKSPHDVSAFLPALTAFFAASMTNPMLFNFVGMAIFSVLIVHWVGIVSRESVVVTGVHR